MVTNLPGDPHELYDQVYCQRGEMENRIKEQQLGLFADRTSCHRMLANQLRLMLSSAAYVLMETVRRIGLAGMHLAQAQVTTIRVKLLKIAARVKVSVRRIVLYLASGCPYQQLFRQAASTAVPTTQDRSHLGHRLANDNLTSGQPSTARGVRGGLRPNTSPSPDRSFHLAMQP